MKAAPVPGTAEPAFAAIITAAGSSRRMGENGKKEYLELADRPLLAWAIIPFLSHCSPIIVTHPAGDAERVRRLLADHLDVRRLILIEGGDTRQESVLNGLRRLEPFAPPGVLIHDGARPWISAGLVGRVIAGVREHGACIPVIGVTEAPKRIQAQGGPPVILESLSREELVLAQTPQGFRFPQILEAHLRAKAGGSRCLDDAEVYGTHIAPVYTIEGERKNRKVTYPEDLEGVCG